MFDEVVSVEVVRHFCHIATKRLGVGFDANAEALVAGRVAKRLQMLQIPLDEYLGRLEEDKDCSEVVGFLDFLRPRPPRFFARPEDHALLHDYLANRIEAGQRRFRLWSAGCGSGEEAYSMAITALDACASVGLDGERDEMGERIDLKILATDISSRMLERGRAGLFDDGQIRGVPGAQFDRYCKETDEGVMVVQKLKSMVYFRRLNLTSLPYPMTGPLDAIFCHEGLAPLVPSARKRAVAATRLLLPEQGLLRSGYSDESLAAAEDDDELLWRDGLGGMSRQPGHC